MLWTRKDRPRLDPKESQRLMDHWCLRRALWLLRRGKESQPGLRDRLAARRVRRLFEDPVNGRAVWEWSDSSARLWMAQRRLGYWTPPPTEAKRPTAS